MTPYQKFCILRDQRRAGEEAPEFTELEAVEAAIAEPLKAQQDAAAKLQRISAAVTGSINTPFDEVLNCINLLVEGDSDQYCQAFLAGRLSQQSPQPDDAEILKQRAIGRAEAAQIIIGLSAEDGLDECIGCQESGQSGEYDAYWKEDKVCALLRVEDAAWSFVKETEGKLYKLLAEQCEREMDKAFSSPAVQPAQVQGKVNP